MATHDAREDLLEPLCRASRLRLPAIQAVLELEERLPDRVRERHARGVDEGDRADAPTLPRG